MRVRRERERGRDSERGTERQRDRETETERDRDTERRGALSPNTQAVPSPEYNLITTLAAAMWEFAK